MIEAARGNLLDADADALVNTVNTVGVMGKGIALQFKKAYPAMFQAYTRAIRSGEIEFGRVHVWETGRLSGPRFIINFPTKGHWKARSRIADIESGLEDLIRVVRDRAIASIAVPPLGCGNGGLDWRVVEPKIREAFAAVPDVRVLLFAPTGTPAASDIASAEERPVMTHGRAALVSLLQRYAEQALTAPGLIESQKLMYFLQSAGEGLRLQFAANRYGPYADNLRHVLNRIEGHFITGYGDGSMSVRDAEPLIVLPEAFKEADALLAQRAETRERIDRVLRLSEGYESAYGLELLATVHWLATNRPAKDDSALVRQVSDWSPRKARMFTEEHVRTALGSLREARWLPPAQPA